MSELIPLKIPNGWAVCDNKFYDTEPLYDKDGFIENWHEGFIEDVLWICECKTLDNGNIGIPDFNCFNIDLGWYPESTREGEYKARLFWDSDNERTELDSISSQNRILIKEKIEYWMADIFENYSEYQFKMLNLSQK
ncbi:hypothetical protein [Flammeovirga sp. SubArs3]|uniref:hypothetical protein n=1 Tax=Flammeovirga sp. SubArs3 TaxID=2995316 RepID=UPI00248B6441|nr:hypothetical protein [Flammeovirga sp. SubArs3]